jgi:hypothetical protein
MPKQDFLEDLQSRNSQNRQIVETVFLPLDQDQRGWQPAPNEWSVDQCFQHLILAFVKFSPNTTAALDKPESPNADGFFKSTWMARRLFPQFFDPQANTKTLKPFNPEISRSPELFTRFLAQQDRLSTMLDRADHADLQTMCWYFKLPPIRFNLGDMLYNFVSHDELHIGQAQRVLDAHAQQVSNSRT